MPETKSQRKQKRIRRYLREARKRAKRTPPPCYRHYGPVQCLAGFNPVQRVGRALRPLPSTPLVIIDECPPPDYARLEEACEAQEYRLYALEEHCGPDSYERLGETFDALEERVINACGLPKELFVKVNPQSTAEEVRDSTNVLARGWRPPTHSFPKS